MTSPLIDDSLVEMVRGTADKVLGEAFAGCFNPHADTMGECADRTCFCACVLDGIARAALAVAAPVIAGKCADVARDVVLVNRRAAMSRTFANGSPGKVRLLDEANAAAGIERTIRSLTKDPQS